MSFFIKSVPDPTFQVIYQKQLEVLRKSTSLLLFCVLIQRDRSIGSIVQCYASKEPRSRKESWIHDMKNHDRTSNEPNIPAAAQMLQLLGGFEVSQALYVIAELGVATALLGGPCTVEDLAVTTGAHVDALWRIIRFLAPLGVFRTNGRKVEVTNLGRTLADGPADSVLGAARYWMETHYAPFGMFLHAARTDEPVALKYFGKPFFEWISESPRLVEIQNAAMAGGTRAGRGNLLEVFQLPKGETIADIGGADGTLLTELLSNRPER
jgi:Dimerisation domain